jgi:hypothetical protein
VLLLGRVRVRQGRVVLLLVRAVGRVGGEGCVHGVLHVVLLELLLVVLGLQVV